MKPTLSTPPFAFRSESTGRHAFLVASGILISQIVGLVRQRVFSHYFGQLDEADAFYAAFRIQIGKPRPPRIPGRLGDSDQPDCGVGAAARVLPLLRPTG